MPLKPNTSAKGAVFESVAAAFLKKQGFEIVEQNVRMKFAEIDLVCRDGDVLCFVEVRSRAHSRFGSPEATVDYRKQAKIMKAASAYLQRLYPRIPRCRFDVVAIKGSVDNPEISHFKNAFGLEQSVLKRKGNPWQAY